MASRRFQLSCTTISNRRQSIGGWIFLNKSGLSKIQKASSLRNRRSSCFLFPAKAIKLEIKAFNNAFNKREMDQLRFLFWVLTDVIKQTANQINAS